MITYCQLQYPPEWLIPLSHIPIALNYCSFSYTGYLLDNYAILTPLTFCTLSYNNFITDPNL